MLNENQIKIEVAYLNMVQDTIDEMLETMEKAVSKCDDFVRELSLNMANSFYEMDDEEVAVQHNIIEKFHQDLDALKQKQFVIQKQALSPYFGRIDFVADDEKTAQNYYIGIATILKKYQTFPLALDWRAPFCSLYYDFSLGRAGYTSPEGQINGEISLKRQYKTLKRELVYAFDSSLTIGDDILKEVLGNNSTDKMKTIVATIQAEQNKIIRNDENINLIVQGVAGSGKTSIALHRVAYLIYKNKISSNDILIISPSSLFSDYINNVLPELGEQNTPKTTLDEIAKKELTGFIEFENKNEMIEDLLKGNIERAKEIAYKSSFEFYNKLKDFFTQYLNASFHAKDIVVGTDVFKADEINKLYNEKYAKKMPSIRIEWITDYLLDKLDIAKQDEKNVFARIKKVLLGMFENSDIKGLYKEFLNSLNLDLREYLTASGNLKIGFEDVPAILFIKNYLIGIETEEHFKHVVIDEMQDYSPVVYHLFNIIFPCKKTILGDIYQSFEKDLDEKYLQDLKNLIGGELLQINKAYRSTVEITEFNNDLIGLKNIKNFDRHGESVRVYDEKSNFFKILSSEIELLSKKYDKIAIITASTEQSEILYSNLSKGFDVQLIDNNSGKASGKLNLLPCIFAKGLEYDAVIYVRNKIFDENINKKITYIACTRALHELVVL